MPMSDQPKRKNDNHRNRRRNLIAQVMLLVVGIFCIVWLRNLQARNGFPTAQLAYNTGGEDYIAINLQTGERTKISIPYDRRHVAPDGKRGVQWNDLNICCDSSLLEDSKSLGVYYRTSHSLSWMPDSRWIVFSATPQEPDYYESQDPGLSGLPEEIFMQDVDTLELKRLTENNYTDRFPSVSPDGKTIAFTSTADGVERLYLMDIVTQNIRLLTPDQDAYKPAWSPDGQWIAFISNADCQPGASSGALCEGGDLWLMRADGTNAQSIVLGSGPGQPLWLP